MQSLQGHLLVATPELLDPNFHRTVVLMVHHDEEGATGLVLNRASNMRISEIWEKVSESPCESHAPVLHGGPCNGPLMAIHTDEFLMETEVAPGVYFCSSPDKLQRLVLLTDQPVQFFAGVAGWGPGQLEDELATGSWHACPAEPEHIFEADANLWDRVTRQIAGQRFLKALNIRQAPDDPSVN